MRCERFDRVLISVGSIRNVSHNVTPALPDGVEIDSVLAVADVTRDGAPTGDLTIQNVAKSSESYTEKYSGDIVAAGKAVQFTIMSSTSKAKAYLLKITYTTNNSPAETIVDHLLVSFLK